MITGAAALSTLLTSQTQAQAAAPTPDQTRTFLELKTYRLHNSQEAQAKRVTDYLETGLFPALTRAGAPSGGSAKPVAAFANLIGPDGPYLLTITQYLSLAAMQDILTKLTADQAHERASQQLSSGSGMPFVSIESTLLHSLTIIPEPAIPTDTAARSPRIFELRTYQNQSMTAQQRKAGMFNGGEIAIFQRLGMRPVFIGESIIGPRQPNITYMLCFDNLDSREKLWKNFGADPAWKALSAPPELKDAEIVANISNTILRPLPFSPVR
jgi:hypothetical protein